MPVVPVAAVAHSLRMRFDFGTVATATAVVVVTNTFQSFEAVKLQEDYLQATW